MQTKGNNIFNMKNEQFLPYIVFLSQVTESRDVHGKLKINYTHVSSHAQIVFQRQ